MERVIAHIDMNAFFASVEQRSNPALRGKPIAVTGSAERTVVTTASYEARAFGVKTGMNKYEARRICPSLIIVAGDNRKYTDTSIRILKIFRQFSPAVEVYSIDEAFLDFTGCERLMGAPEVVGARIKERILDKIGITCSVGISTNKLMAKLASGMEKPDGLVRIRDEDIAKTLSDLPVEKLWGIGPGLTRRLEDMGVRSCGELSAVPAGVLRRRFGIVGERLSLMARGVDTSPVVPVGSESEVKSIGHSTTLKADLCDGAMLKRQIMRLAEMVGRRARSHGFRGRRVSLVLRYTDFYTFSRQKTLSGATDDPAVIRRAARSILRAVNLSGPVRLVGVSLSRLERGACQLSLFESERTPPPAYRGDGRGKRPLRGLYRHLGRTPEREGA